MTGVWVPQSYLPGTEEVYRDEQTNDTQDYRDGFTLKTIYDRKDQAKVYRMTPNFYGEDKLGFLYFFNVKKREEKNLSADPEYFLSASEYKKEEWCHGTDQVWVSDPKPAIIRTFVVFPLTTAFIIM